MNNLSNINTLIKSSFYLCLCLAVFFFLEVSLAFHLVIFYFFGGVVCFILANKNRNDLKNLIFILISSSFVYFTYSFYVGISYEINTSFFLFPDQNYLYDTSQLLKLKNSVSDIFESTIINKTHIENEGYYFFNGVIAYFHHNYLSGNSVTLQSLMVSSFAVFINLLLYSILKHYVCDRESLKYTFIFSMLSVSFAYSPWILRDIHILFFYTLGFYFIHKKFSIKNMLVLFVIQIVVIQFRFSSGLAYLFFPLYYIFIQGKKYKFRKLLYLFLAFASIPIVINIINLVISSFFQVGGRLTRYAQLTNSEILESGGLSVYIYKLPIGIKEFFIVAYSQLQPFPAWTGIENAENVFEVIVIGIFGLTGIFWSYVMFVSVSSLLKNYKSVPTNLIIMLCFSVLFLLLNTTNMNPRRIMAIYPILYVFFVYSQIHFNSRVVVNKRKVSFLILYFLLIFIYLLLGVKL